MPMLARSTASPANTDIKITITDRAMCHDIFGLVRDFERVRDTDRTLTISVNRLAPVSAS